MAMKSIKSIYKIGHGPSSSHTVGPYRAAGIFAGRYPEADHFRITLYGSLAFTGEGHGTGKAILSALPGATVLFDRTTRKISFDDVVATMYRTGLDMDEKYRETSHGGLATIYRAGLKTT